MHIRRWTHRPPTLRQSSQPSDEGLDLTDLIEMVAELLGFQHGGSFGDPDPPAMRLRPMVPVPSGTGTGQGVDRGLDLSARRAAIAER